MRFLSLKTGLLLALVPLSLAFAAGEEQDDKSYLPPSSLRGKPEEAPALFLTAPPGRGFLFPVLAERIIGGVACRPPSRTPAHAGRANRLASPATSSAG